MKIDLGIKTRLIKPELMKEALITAGKMVQDDAKLTAPVDTGRLRGSITMAMTDYVTNTESPATIADAVSGPEKEMVVKIGTNVEYAAFVEYKNGGIYAYLRRALLMNVQRIKKVFNDALKRSVEG